MPYDEFIEELKKFCLSHGYEIAGTCSYESIYGEITVLKIGSDTCWIDWGENKFNFEPA